MYIPMFSVLPRRDAGTCAASAASYRLPADWDDAADAGAADELTVAGALPAVVEWLAAVAAPWELPHADAANARTSSVLDTARGRPHRST